jgi:hypothetical protein
VLQSIPFLFYSNDEESQFRTTPEQEIGMKLHSDINKRKQETGIKMHFDIASGCCKEITMQQD